MFVVGTSKHDLGFGRDGQSRKDGRCTIQHGEGKGIRVRKESWESKSPYFEIIGSSERCGLNDIFIIRVELFQTSF